MLWLPLLTAAIGHAAAFGDIPVPGSLSGRWKLVRAECAAGSHPDENAVPTPEQGSLVLTSFGDEELRTMFWSRFVKKGACSSSAASLLFLTRDDEGTDISLSLPGYMYLFQDFVPFRGWRLGFHCPQFPGGRDPLFKSTNRFYRRAAGDPAEFKWRQFNSKACVPQQDLTLTFRRLVP